MKTKRMIILLAALMVGVIVNAQSVVGDVKNDIDKAQFDKLKIMDYSFDLSDLISVIPFLQEDAQEGELGKCMKEKEISKTCGNLLKRNGKPHPYFPKYPDTRVPDKKTR